MKSAIQMKINETIRECIEYCCESNNIVTGIAKFTVQLRNSGDWQESDIRAVETSVRRLFAGIVNGVTHPADSQNTLFSDVRADSKVTKVSEA